MLPLLLVVQALVSGDPSMEILATEAEAALGLGVPAMPNLCSRLPLFFLSFALSPRLASSMETLLQLSSPEKPQIQEKRKFVLVEFNMLFPAHAKSSGFAHT